MLYYVVSYYSILHYIISYHVTSYHIISCVYIYICTYICLHTYIYIHICICTHTYIYLESIYICIHICIYICILIILYPVFALVSNPMSQRTQVGRFQEDYRQANRNKFGDVPPDLTRHQVAGWWALALQYSTALCVLFV